MRSVLGLSIAISHFKGTCQKLPKRQLETIHDLKNDKEKKGGMGIDGEFLKK